MELGIITSIECNHKQIETARKGQEVCIKIEPIPGEAPKMFGRHFEDTDMLVSKVCIIYFYSIHRFVDSHKICFNSEKIFQHIKRDIQETNMFRETCCFYYLYLLCCCLHIVFF